MRWFILSVENPSQTEIEMMHAKVNFYAMKVGEHTNILKFIGVVDDNVRK
jgi:hypothetical protein